MTTADSLARRIIGDGWNPGMIPDMPAEIYHASPGLSCSMIKKADPLPSSMLHAIQREEREREEAQRIADAKGEVLPSVTEDTEHFLVGSMLHQAILEPDKKIKPIAVEPEKYTNAKGEECDWTYKATLCKKWRNDQRLAGNVVMSRKAASVASCCVAVLLENATVRRYLARGIGEVSIWRRFSCPAGPILLRSRLDWVPPGDSLVDIKTVANAGDAEPSRFRDIAERMGYDMQSAMYLDAWNTLPDDQKPDGWSHKDHFVFIVVEKVAPFPLSFVYLNPSGIEIGRREYADRAYAIAEACHTGDWRGYPQEPVGVEPSPWRSKRAREEWA